VGNCKKRGEARKSMGAGLTGQKPLLKGGKLEKKTQRHLGEERRTPFEPGGVSQKAKEGSEKTKPKGACPPGFVPRGFTDKKGTQVDQCKKPKKGIGGKKTKVKGTIER